MSYLSTYLTDIPIQGLVKISWAKRGPECKKFKKVFSRILPYFSFQIYHKDLLVFSLNILQLISFLHSCCLLSLVLFVVGWSASDK